jgi:hypothetical protein
VSIAFFFVLGTFVFIEKLCVVHFYIIKILCFSSLVLQLFSIHLSSLCTVWHRDSYISVFSLFNYVEYFCSFWSIYNRMNLW